MFDKEQSSKFKENFKANRAVYITAISILAVMILIVTIVAVTNRNKQETPDPTPPASSTTTTTNQQEPNNDSIEDVSSKLPSFALPVSSGKLFKAHDSEMQVYSETMEDYRVHLGVDILSSENAPVYAAADGMVTQIWEDVLMGQCIAVQHSGNAVSIYKNLSATLPDGIKEGTTVKSGQQIGSVGSSAMIEIADEPHLHFEMTVDGLSVDPLEYFSNKDIETLKTDTSFETPASSEK